jgi:hypothetical protein
MSISVEPEMEEASFRATGIVQRVAITAASLFANRRHSRASVSLGTTYTHDGANFAITTSGITSVDGQARPCTPETGCVRTRRTVE